MTTAPDGYTLIIYGGSAPISVNEAGSTIRPEIGSEETALGDVQVLNTQTYEWSGPNITGNIPSARFGHTAVQVGWQMIVMGGSTGNSFSIIPTSETIVFDTTIWSWMTDYTPTIWPDVFNQTTDLPSTPTPTSTQSAAPQIRVEATVVISVRDFGALVLTALAAFTVVIILLWRRRDSRWPDGHNSGDQDGRFSRSTQVDFLDQRRSSPLIRGGGAGRPLLKRDVTRPETPVVKPDDTVEPEEPLRPGDLRVDLEPK
ncbi:LOW QUALITY PROTEIN: hypothetical protein BC938DRAFT_479509 [Jimgerdemannia flammicorona]|uniref:Uncharacterized protein n=1 Tax=Jimgerdemannia flammicorona TaxID=994334 RepID=A0A433QY07_9FUNG|nr:LOW QUALITY PROTEIN: hypothetical protein BC938DRAFT_479509 [Jimgerdemannia flammicorona]